MYIVDIGEDAAAARTLADAREWAQEMVSEHGRAVLCGGRWDSVEVAVVLQSVRGSNVPVYAVWRTKERGRFEYYESRSPSEAKQVWASMSSRKGHSKKKNNPLPLPRGQIAGDPPKKGTEVEVYRNLNVRNQVAWSLRSKETRLVIAVVPSVVLTGAVMHVSESGRQRVMRQKSKTVHAWVAGRYAGEAKDGRGVKWTSLRYNPYETKTFVDRGTGRAVKKADQAMLTDKGAFYSTSDSDRRSNPARRDRWVEDWNG